MANVLHASIAAAGTQTLTIRFILIRGCFTGIY